MVLLKVSMKKLWILTVRKRTLKRIEHTSVHESNEKKALVSEP